MNQTINAMVKEQFGTGNVPDKVWLVMTDDVRNLTRQPVDENGRFLPGILLEGIHGETKEDALCTFMSCFHRRAYGVVETAEEAMAIFKYAPIVMWDGKFVRR